MKYLSIEQAAAMLGLSPSTLQENQRTQYSLRQAGWSGALRRIGPAQMVFPARETFRFCGLNDSISVTSSDL
jgi:hypothetical protein